MLCVKTKNDVVSVKNGAKVQKRCLRSKSHNEASRTGHPTEEGTGVAARAGAGPPDWATNVRSQAVLTDARFCEHTKSHWIVHFKTVNFTLRELRLEKAVTKQKPRRLRSMVSTGDGTRKSGRAVKGCRSDGAGRVLTTHSEDRREGAASDRKPSAPEVRVPGQRGGAGAVLAARERGKPTRGRRRPRGVHSRCRRVSIGAPLRAGRPASHRESRCRTPTWNTGEPMPAHETPVGAQQRTGRQRERTGLRGEAGPTG